MDFQTDLTGKFTNKQRINRIFLLNNFKEKCKNYATSFFKDDC